MKIVLLTLLALLLIPTRSTAPVQSNPYCQQGGVIYTPPIALCPEGQRHDPQCLAACIGTYKDTVRAAKLAACIAWNQADVARQECLSNATTAHETCIALGGSPLTCAALLAFMNGQCNDQWTADQQAIEATYATAYVGANAALASCAAGCCRAE